MQDMTRGIPVAIDRGRRHFVETAALAVAASQVSGCIPFGPLDEGALPSFGASSRWLNSAPLEPAGLLGRVVMVNFWTFTCINWLRTLPYIRAWAARYGDHGLVVIGVHTPEFPFEHNVDSVIRSNKAFGIEFPVVIDNDYAIWRAFKNNYWPAFYFADARGRIRHHRFGEGDYERSEAVIRDLLTEAGASLPAEAPLVVEATGVEAPADWRNLKSPENYLGYGRTQNFSSPGGIVRDTPHIYTVPDQRWLNQWALDGYWRIGQRAATLVSQPGRITCRFHARDLHLVMGPPLQSAPVRFRVLLDDKAPGPAAGTDIDEHGNGTAVDQRLYQLIRQPAPINDRQFEIEFLDPGVEAYAFTFG